MRKSAGWTALLIVLATCIEGISFGVTSFAPQLDQFFHRPHEVTEVEYNQYVAERHPTIGWPSDGWHAELSDAQNARLSPANSALGENEFPCISVYGDSFAFSEEVTDGEAWTNLMALSMRCRVNNHGVGGFGTDQAVLWFEEHLATDQPVGQTVILTLYPDNLNRNMNQWRSLFVNWPLTFKPAYLQRPDGTFKLSPIFDGDFSAFQVLAEDPAAALPAERYLPDTSGFYRKIRARFPYSLTLGRLILRQFQTFRGFNAYGVKFYNYPGYYDTSEGPSEEKKAVTIHIISRFAKLCEMYDKTCAFVVTPDPELVLQREQRGGHDLDPWLKKATAGLIFLDGTDIFTDLDDICAHVTNPQGCNGHYNAAGYARLADFVSLGLKNATGN